MIQDPSSSNDREKDETEIGNPDSEKRASDAQKTTGEPVVTQTETTAETEGIVPDAARTPDPASTERTSSTDRPAAVRASRSGGASTPSLVAAGILGGLIALLAAGSMQYAGYLPGAAPAVGSATSAEVAGLRGEIDGIKQQLSTIPAETPVSADLDKRLAAIEERVGRIPTGDTKTALRISALEQKIGSMQAGESEALASDRQKIEEISNRLAAAERTLEDQPGETAVSRAIAATYLKAAVDRGDPFLTELETFAALSPQDPAIEDLRPMAATGVKSRAALSEAFGEQAKIILDAVDQPAAGNGITDRLLASARSLISVRPVGNVEGSTPGAIVARMEERLKNGDIKGAALEWEGLPEPGRKASEAYKVDLDKRVKADELTSGLAERGRTPALNAG